MHKKINFKWLHDRRFVTDSTPDFIRVYPGARYFVVLLILIRIQQLSLTDINIYIDLFRQHQK